MTLDQLSQQRDQIRTQIKNLHWTEKPFIGDYEIEQFELRTGKTLPGWDRTVIHMAKHLDMPLKGYTEGRGGWLIHFDEAHEKAVIEAATIDTILSLMPDFTDAERAEYLALMKQSVAPEQETPRYDALRSEEAAIEAQMTAKTLVQQRFEEEIQWCVEGQPENGAPSHSHVERCARIAERLFPELNLPHIDVQNGTLTLQYRHSSGRRVKVAPGESGDTVKVRWTAGIREPWQEQTLPEHEALAFAQAQG